MTDTSREGIMGFFDALSSSCFKTGANGRHLFFPYGVVGRGYVLRSQDECERLRGKMSGWIVGALAVAVLTVPFPQIALLVSAFVFISLYVAWASAVTRGLERTDERMTLSESLPVQAHAYNIVVLWLLELGSLGFVAGGIFLLIVDPRQWPIALLAGAFFGFGAWIFARMLLARRKTAAVP